MGVEDIKLYGANFLSISLSFSSLHDSLKLLLLVATLGYTLHKWYHFYIDKKNKK